MTRQAAGYESHEYERLKERKFRPYSRGHQVMYLQPIAELLRDRGKGNTRVLEAGFGIGWGLGAMASAGILKSYVGYEPNDDSFTYTKAKYGPLLTAEGVDHIFLRGGFEPNLDPAFDVAFCIEVIEHVPMEQHVDFLRGLHSMAPLLYLSTPCKLRVPSEGVRTKDDWVLRIIEAGFSKVDVMTKEWTYLYRCVR